MDTLQRDYVGSAKSGKFPLLPGGIKYERMQFTAVESQLLESRKWNSEEITRLLGGKPLCVKLGYGAEAAYASNAAFLEDYFATALLPITVNFEQSIMRDLIAPKDRATLFVRHDADVILRGSPKERAERDEIEIRSGKKSPNECREADDLDPIDGWDKMFYPANSGVYDPETGEMFIPGQKPPDTTNEGTPAPAKPAPAPAVKPPTATLQASESVSSGPGVGLYPP